MHSQYRESGKVTINFATCKHCGLCANICPAHVLVMENSRMRVSDESPFGCIACGHCMMICPNGSVTVTGRGVSPEDMQSLPLTGQKASADALAALMLSRRSVRHFTNREVKKEMLEKIVEMASTAPMGIPPWDVGCIMISDRHKVKSLSIKIIKGYAQFLKIFKPWLLAVMRPFVGRETYEKFRSFIRPLAEQYVNGMREGKDLLFYDAPAVIIFTHSPYAEPVDAAIACTYAMLAAESLGLGSTMIGGAPPILQRNKKLCESLGIPKGHMPSLALIVGYADTDFKRCITRKFAFNKII